MEPEHLSQLVAMGFPAPHAKNALVATHNTGVETALGWLLEKAGTPDIDDEPEPLSTPRRSAGKQRHCLMIAHCVWQMIG